MFYSIIYFTLAQSTNKHTMKNKLNVYKVTPLVDEALKISLSIYDMKRGTSEEKFVKCFEILEILTQMSKNERDYFIRIENEIGSSFKDDKADIGYNNTQFENSCSFFEFNEKKDVVKAMFWSSDEDSLVNIFKMLKKSYDKSGSTFVEKTEQNTWSWMENGMDYRFIFSSEYEAYKDLISYLSSVKNILDYSKQ